LPCSHPRSDHRLERRIRHRAAAAEQVLRAAAARSFSTGPGGRLVWLDSRLSFSDLVEGLARAGVLRPMPCWPRRGHRAVQPSGRCHVPVRDFHPTTRAAVDPLLPDPLGERRPGCGATSGPRERRRLALVDPDRPGFDDPGLASSRSNRGQRLSAVAARRAANCYASAGGDTNPDFDTDAGRDTRGHPQAHAGGLPNASASAAAAAAAATEPLRCSAQSLELQLLRRNDDNRASGQLLQLLLVHPVLLGPNERLRDPVL